MKQTIAILAGALLALSTGCSGSSAGSSSTSGSTGRNAATGTTTTSGSTSRGSSGSSGSIGGSSGSGSGSTTTAGSSGSSGSSGSDSGSSSGSSGASTGGSTGSTTSGSGSSGSTGAPIPGTPITIISIQDFHPAAVDGGEQRVPEYDLPGRFSALIPLGDGGYTVLPDLGLDGGYDTIPGGPDAGSFFVKQFGGQFTETASHTVDYSQDFLGKPNLGVVTNPTPVTFNLTGFTPIGAADLLEVSALQDDALLDTSLPGSVAYPDAGPTFIPNETSVSGTVDWSTYAVSTNDGQAAAIDPGEPFFAAKLTTVDGGAGGADQFTRLDSFIDLTGQSVADGVPSTVQGAAVAQPATKPFSTLLQRATVFETQFPAGSTYSGIFYDVGVVPQGHATGLIDGFISTPDLAYGNLVKGVTPAPVNLSFNYANPYPSAWDEVYYLQRTFPLPITVSASANGTLTQYQYLISANFVANLPAAQTAGIGPVQAVKVNGQSADTNLGPIGVTPTISWTAPSTGAVTGYRVRLTEVAYDATTSKVTTRFRGFAALLPTTTSFTFPPNRFVAGRSYVVEVLAFAEPGTDFSVRPGHRSLPEEVSMVSTHLLTP